MEDLILAMLTYSKETLETENERESFIRYMEEAFKRYVIDKKGIDIQQERAFKKLRQILDNKKES